jgi:hypothetical protein
LVEALPAGSGMPLKEGGITMKVYRSSMEKILEKQENDTVITNPKEPVRTFFRKVRFTLSRWAETGKRIFRGSARSSR